MCSWKIKDTAPLYDLLTVHIIECTQIHVIVFTYLNIIWFYLKKKEIQYVISASNYDDEDSC